jgi:TetR/AcrR family transcriptional repressor of nem operon
MATETTVRGRGRPREFDTDEVLDRVVNLFWDQGYEATSMSDIVAATGLNKSSLYNSFGSKEELFGIAIDRYVEMQESMLKGVLRDGHAGLDDILTFLDYVRREIGGPTGSRGCLAVNTTTELGNRDNSIASMSARYRGEMRTSARAALDRAAAAGEISRELTGHYAETLIAFLLSMSVMARGGAPSAEVDDQFAAIRSLIESWRLAD